MQLYTQRAYRALKQIHKIKKKAFSIHLKRHKALMEELAIDTFCKKRTNKFFNDNEKYKKIMVLVEHYKDVDWVTSNIRNTVIAKMFSFMFQERYSKRHAMFFMNSNEVSNGMKELLKNTPNTVHKNE